MSRKAPVLREERENFVRTWHDAYLAHSDVKVKCDCQIAKNHL